MTDNNNKNLIKALSFLLSKEVEDFSIEQKKQFLLTKLPEDIVNQAIELYPIVQNNISKNEDNNQSMFSSMFDIGILTSSILTSLIINYLFDINREKKNISFSNELSNRLNEEQLKNNESIKAEIDNKLEDYVDKKDLPVAVNHELEIFSQGKPLTINPSLAKVKNDMNAIKKDIITLNTKIDDSMYILSKNVKEDIQSLLNQYFPKPVNNNEEVINTCNNSNNII